MDQPFIIQRPDESRQLFLLFHGAGGEAADMQAVGLALAKTFPHAAVVSLPAPDACDAAPGRQWFSESGAGDGHAERIAQAMPGFAAAISRWQADTGVEPPATALVGFSQGGTMVLAATQRDDALAGRAIVLAGPFCPPLTHAAPDTTIHLIHGQDDSQAPSHRAEQAAQALADIGGDATLDVLPGVAHEITQAVTDKLLERLLTTVPRRIWEAAMRERPQQG